MTTDESTLCENITESAHCMKPAQWEYIATHQGITTIVRTCEYCTGSLAVKLLRNGWIITRMTAFEVTP